MSIVEVFASNLSALMDVQKELDSQYKLGSAAGLGPTNVGRFRRGDVAAQIDSVEKVAKAFKLRACDILDPDLLKRLAAGEPLRMGEPRPPVMPNEDWRAMSPRARALVEDLCARTLTGQLNDDDIKWLHDALERTQPKPAAPVAGQIATEVAARKLTTNTDDFAPAVKKPA